jgi:alkanesulfonate monooxygenase SsuD/methylene tetrahydromethanopterin reductase-like flavin-dependent oxidoreductase (luciferase family)
MTRPVTFGMMVFPQAAPYGLFAERCRRAEAMGFDNLWVADETPMEFPAGEFEAWSVLGALARETTRIRIGTLVTPITFRHPVVLGMAVSTVDHISNGRVSLGLGAGGGAKDEAGLGVSWSAGERIVRLEAQVAILDPLLRGESVTRESGPYLTKEAQIPPTIQRPRPPIVVAAQGPRGLAVVARHADVWNSLGGQPLDLAREKLAFEDAVATVKRHVDLLDDACRRSGRDPDTIGRSVLTWRYDEYASANALADFVHAYRSVGFDEFILTWPRKTPSYSAQEAEALLEDLAKRTLPALRAA